VSSDTDTGITPPSNGVAGGCARRKAANGRQSTAKTYVARLYEKLGVANRAQALMAAMQLGLIRHEHGAPAGGARSPGSEHTINLVAAPA
jgi:hypothetical protein